MVRRIHSGLDELAMEQGFARRPEDTLTRCVFNAIQALRGAGTNARRGHYPPNGGAPQIVLPDGSTLTFHQTRKTWATLYVYVAQRALHAHTPTAHDRALHALQIAAAACHDVRVAPAPKPPRLRSVALFVDVEGWRPSPLTIDRFTNRSGIELVPWGRDEDGRYTNYACKGFIRLYNKTADMANQPSKAYVRAIHERNGWRPENGPVWRFEVTYNRARLLRLSKRTGNVLPSFDALWAHALATLRLHRKPYGLKVKDMGRWPEAPVWRELRTATDWEPWAERPQPPAPFAQTDKESFERKMATLMGLAISAAIQDGRRGQPPALAICGLVEDHLRRHPHKADEYALRLAEEDEDESPAAPACDPMRPTPEYSPDEIGRILASLGTRHAHERLN